MQTVDINQELYVPILSALNVDVDMGTGQLMMKYPDRTLAATVSKRNLLLPTQEVLRALPENALVFHPLSENVARGDSAIQNYLKTLVTFKVTFAITYIAQQLYTIASNQKLHEKLKGDQLTILSILPNADAKGAANLARVLESIEMNKVRLYNVFNKRNGSIGGSTFNRVAVATFPLLSEMEERKGLWGHRDVRKGDMKDFKALFDYIVPEWNEKDHYSAASNSMEAPSFQALMLAFIKIMEPLNRVAKIYGEHFVDVTEDGEKVDMAPYVSANTEFQHRLTNLSTYRNVLPVMQGNDGEALAGASATTQEVVQNPRSVAPAFIKQNLGDDIKVPEQQVQQQQQVSNYQTPSPVNTAPINPQGYVQQQQHMPQQQQLQQQTAPTPGVSGFGNYSSAAAQQRVQPVYPAYGHQGGYQNQGYSSGVAGFGNYGNQQQQQMPGIYGNQQIQQQQQTAPTPFDEWNRTAMQQQQQTAYQQQQRIQQNPYTTPSTPNSGVYGFGNYGNQQQQQMPQQPPQLVTLQNGQQIWVDAYGRQVPPPQQQGFYNGQQQMFGQQNAFTTPSNNNPYGVQQIGFKTY